MRINRLITKRYEQLANAFQEIVDPAFPRSGPRPVSHCTPNWYAIVSHASHCAGNAIAGAELGLASLDLVQTRKAKSPLQDGNPAVPAIQHQAAPGRYAQLALVLAAARSFDVRRAGGIREVARDTYALMRLVRDAPQRSILGKVRSVFLTLQNSFMVANEKIFQDMAPLAEKYLEFRRQRPLPSADVVLREFSLPRSNPERARRVYRWATAHLGRDIRQMFRVHPDVTLDDMTVASFAMLETARGAKGQQKEELIRSANSYLIFREQFGSVEPALHPTTAPASEVDRTRVMHAVTPSFRMVMGDTVWSNKDYLERSNSSSEPNWATFEFRWNAIHDALNAAYACPEEVWRLPAGEQGL